MARAIWLSQLDPAPAPVLPALVDTMYGQLLRRMRPLEGSARYGVVVPSSALAAALRVLEWVRERLQVEVYAVDSDGTVICG